MIALGLALAIALMKLAPSWDISRWLHRHLVERPVDWMSCLERRHVIFALLLIGALLLAQDFIAVAGPADMAFAFLWDVSMYVDVVGVTLAVAAVRALKTMWTIARHGDPRRLSTRARARRTRPERKAAANDDDAHRAAA